MFEIFNVEINVLGLLLGGLTGTMVFFVWNVLLKRVFNEIPNNINELVKYGLAFIGSLVSASGLNSILRYSEPNSGLDPIINILVLSGMIAVTILGVGSLNTFLFHTMRKRTVVLMTIFSFVYVFMVTLGVRIIS